jgi:hypothetical protein
MVAVIFLWPVTSSGRMLLNPHQTDYPASIREQYFTGWTSGLGLREVIGRLRSWHDSALENETVVLRSPLWDLPLQGLNLYQHELPKGLTTATLEQWIPSLLSGYRLASD